ncbi:RNA-binding domain-containing protein [Artomyces pyxidatus]|uniref:RNA-binding domain-containing protein n=1 Tax=Artomyces pyxidatus TaxID=48021 RepID=A0ACB8T8A9_9AGAM|nr:RNA-binding domain-containing protein [Artomyces pyxidatus]
MESRHRHEAWSVHACTFWNSNSANRSSTERARFFRRHPLSLTLPSTSSITAMSRRLYLGKLPPDTRTDDVAKFFDGYGKIVDCRVMTGFGFVEFEAARDADDALQHFNGKSFMGSNLVVEFAKESRPRREPYDDRYGGPPRSRRPPGIRIIVSGISRDTSWQDLKDFGREAGSVSFADIDRDNAGQGILEYLAREDAERAVKDLDGKDLRGQPVRVTLQDDRGPDNYRRDDRRGGGEERGGYRDDRYREERYRGADDRYDRSHRDERASYRRERSRSPPRRGEDDRRPPRSPPPRREVDERRPAGEEPERRRDDRRRDEKDDRYDDRAPSRHANGDGGWR